MPSTWQVFLARFLQLREGGMNWQAGKRGHFRLLLRFLLCATILGAGFWARSLPPRSVTLGPAGWWPWKPTTMVTLYFADGRFFFPVSRRMPTSDDLPRAALEALLAGPSAGSGLTNPIPPGVAIRSFQLAGGVAHRAGQVYLLSGYPESRGPAGAV